MDDQISQAKLAGDAASFVIVSGTLVGWLPSIAAVLTIIWTAIRIYETRTVQRGLAVCLGLFPHRRGKGSGP